MLRLNRKILPGLVVGAGLLAASQMAHALFDPGVGVGVEYTDNAGLTDTNEESDLILLGYLGANFSESTGRLSADAVGRLVYEEYTDNTFSDQYYWDVDANLGYEQVRNRLIWTARNRFTQRRVDSLAPDTPDNSQDTNIFSFGPSLTWPVTDRHTLGLTPNYRKFYYEESNVDNQEFSLAGNWLYLLRPTIRVGLDGNVRKTKYDNSRQNPDLLSKQVQAVMIGTGPSSQYSLNLGATFVQRDDVDDQEGFSGNFDYVRTLTGVSDVRLYLSTDLTDANNDAYNAATNPNRGNVNNVQINGDVIRNYIGRAEYLRSTTGLTSRLWLELRELDYKETPNDREIREIGLDLNRPVTPRLSAGLYGSFNRVEETDIDRTDERYLAGGDLTFQFTPRLKTILNVQYQTKDSDDSINEYDEMSGFIGVIYGYGNVNRTRKGRNTTTR